MSDIVDLKEYKQRKVLAAASMQAYDKTLISWKPKLSEAEYQRLRTARDDFQKAIRRMVDAGQV